ncbi:MAG: hypothetical protein J7500_08825 [Sphingomonas sp.]|uniref:hypothetical protein n=1 Tax=Sphingomonas sp. TaxID=28214 RepID=UPI001B2CB06B|nr:hypothetical protein [Sphingomonas sp.]MBO9622803.1 hypothetical protein [Sphingomonas sp.]
MHLRPLSGLALAAGLLLVPGASAQRAGEITVFSGIGFTGRAFTLSGQRDTLNLGWTVRSVRMGGGPAWDLCTRTNFRTPCNRVTRNVTNVRWTVASARPTVATPGPEPIPPQGGGGASLRGMTAEFFVAPADARGRIETSRQGTAAAASEAANRFCRSRGWVGSSYERQETVGGRNFLADVLCTRTG